MKAIWQQAFDNPRFHFPVIFIVALLIFFPYLGARDFWDHENEYAEIIVLVQARVCTGDQ